MFHWHRDRKKTASGESEKPAGRRLARGGGKHGSESDGFTGLEGDFEAERRRAAEAAHEPAQPYEGEGDKPAVPGSTAGWTHP